MSEINNIESTQDNTAINDLPAAATGSMDNALSPIYLAAYPQPELTSYEFPQTGPVISEIAAESIEGPVQVSSVDETQEPAYVESDERYLEKYTKQYIKQLEEARKHFKKDSPDGEAEIGKVVIRYKSKDEKSDLEKPADFKIGPDGKLLKLSDKKAGLDEDLIVEVEVDDSASKEVREAAAQQASMIRSTIARLVSEQAGQHIPIEIPAELQSQLSAAENVSAPAPQVTVRRGGDRGGYTSAPVSRGFGGGGGLSSFFNSFRPSKIGQSFHNGISRIGHGIEKAISHVPGMGGLTHTKLSNTKVVANVAEHIAKDTGIKDTKQFAKLAVAMMLVESKGDNRAVGDHGTSFGLFQLHKGGMLTTAGLSKEQAMNPETNAKVALSNLAKVVKDGNYSSLGEAAAKSQRPANPQEYARRVNACLDQADNLIALADKPLNFSKGEQLARSAELVAGNKRPGGYCGLGTSDSIYNAGLGRYRGNANDLFDKLLASGKFVEIPVDNAPRGAVVFRPWSNATMQRKHEDHGDIAVLLDSNTRKAANDGIVNVARTNKGYYDDSKARAIFPV